MNQHIPQGSAGPGSQSATEGTVGTTSEKVKQMTQQTTDKLKAKAGEISTQARAKGESFIDEKKERAADKIEGASETLHETSERFERENDPNIAHYTRILADKLEDAAHYVRERTFSDLRHDASDLARRHPAVFYGGMFVAGMAVARFLKASVERPEEEFEFETDEDLSGAPQLETASQPSMAEPEYPSHPVPTI